MGAIRATFCVQPVFGLVTPSEKAAALEFDLWAESGRDASMAEGHRSATEAVTSQWVLNADSQVLDVGCGNGWAVRSLVERGAAKGYGIDISPKMIAAAKAATSGDERYDFQVAAAERTPFSDGQMSHILNVESLYYYPDPAVALQEWARICRIGGHLSIMVDLYLESPATHTWINALDVDVHLLSTADILAMAKAAGWSKLNAISVKDPRPMADEASFKTGPYWPNYAMYKAYRETGSLLIYGQR
jgi:SAM-dependent methyltransferase